MRNSILFMLRLVASALMGAEPPKQEGNINWEQIYEIAKKHSIANIVAYPITSGGYDISKELKDKFSQKLYERVFVSEKQNQEFRKLSAMFNQKNISYMPLKGLLLQELYPSGDMRTMVDGDILIKCDEYEKIAPIMKELGYSFTGESDHEYNYEKKPFIHIELHKHLIPSYNEDMYAYFGDGWDKAKKTEGSNGRYELSVEDNFIYILSHFAKHYRDGGIGIRHAVDIWILLKKYKDMDKEYLEKNLKELNLLDFYKNVIKLLAVWFEDGEFDEITSSMTVYILNSGNFGTMKNAMSAEAIRENENVADAGKFKYVKFVFPSLGKMKKIFPVLEKFPVLLPVMWVFRVVRLVLFRREKISTYKNQVESIQQESIDEYAKHLKMAGLDIYNGRKNL